jgi:tRNA pseudouridine55 synthase
MFGILLIKKELGTTSHDVVNQVRRKFNTRRVGHAGTLDPLATGLLVVAVGPATRFLQYLPLEPKEYIADIEFGAATTTYDREGERILSGPVPEDLAGAIDLALVNFRGLITQLPPIYSAVKVNGQAMYKYARAGKEVPREPRTVHIAEYEMLSVNGNVARARIVCSGGTYIRTLAHDLGEALGCGAHLAGLERTRVGRYTLAEGLLLSDATPEDLISLRDALPPMPLLDLTEEQVEAVRFGRQLGLAQPPGNYLVGLCDPNGNVISVARVIGNMLQPECVIPAEVAHVLS